MVATNNYFDNDKYVQLNKYLHQYYYIMDLFFGWYASVCVAICGFTCAVNMLHTIIKKAPLTDFK